MMEFVEYLTFRTWLVTLLPRWLARRARGSPPRRCYALNASRVAGACVRGTAWLTRVECRVLTYRLADVRDEDGLLLRLRIAYRDLAQAQQLAMTHAAFQEAAADDLGEDRGVAYLAKAIATIGFSERGTLWRALMTIQVAAWAARREGHEGPVVLTLEALPWFDALTRYAASQGVELRPAPAVVFVRAWLRRLAGRRLAAWARYLTTRWDVRGKTTTRTASAPERPRGPRAAVQYYGHLHLDQPALYSDLTFWQHGSFAAGEVLILFSLAEDPLTDEKLRELTSRGVDAVALTPAATTSRDARITLPDPRGVRAHRRLRLANRSREARWLEQAHHEYQRLRASWRDVFAREGVRVFLSWFKYDATHCAIADALRDLDGVMAIYQRAFEELPSAETAVDVDVLFGFSRAAAEIEEQSGSRIRYHVTTGYIGDHRFALLHDQARTIRDRVRARGARHILAFFDENSRDDPRWHTGHEFMRDNYAFLLERLLDDASLGLLLKPKVPSSLRRRLGPVAELLRRAEATGRCIVYEGGRLHGAYPPAAAALAADVVIHGHLCAATGGLESALAGKPTLLLDREGWSASHLYRLGVGRVVFTDWAPLWHACREHWSRPDGIPGFGDWSDYLAECDPFRDGRAAERMGTYVRWLLDSFKAGEHRETAMASAAERYATRWGARYVREIGSFDAQPASAASRQLVGTPDVG